MFFTYILQSEFDDSFYIGQTNNLEARILRHNAGRERYTRKKTPWTVIFHKAFETRAEAMQLEKRLKSFKNREYLLQWIEDNSI